MSSQTRIHFVMTVAFALCIVGMLAIVWCIDTYSPPTYTKVEGECVVEYEHPNLFGDKHEIGRVCGVSGP